MEDGRGQSLKISSTLYDEAPITTCGLGQPQPMSVSNANTMWSEICSSSVLSTNKTKSVNCNEKLIKTPENYALQMSDHSA